MKRFRFRLEQLLEIRKYREREWELKLAHITGICVNLQRDIQDMQAEEKRAFNARTVTDEYDIEYLQTTERYIKRLQQNVEKLSKELAVKEVEREKVRRQFQEVSKQRKILAKLKERKQREDYKLQRDEEIKTIDDINMSNFLR